MKTVIGFVAILLFTVQVNGHWFKHIIHEAKSVIKSDGAKLLLKDAAVDLATGASGKIVTDVIRDVGVDVATHALLKSRNGKKVNQLLHRVSKHIDHEINKILKPTERKVNKFIAPVKDALHHVVKKIEKSVKSLEKRHGISIPHILRNHLIVRALGSAAVASGIVTHKTAKLAEDLAMKVQQIAPMNTKKLLALQRDFHQLLVTQRKSYEFRFSNALHSMNVTATESSLDAVINELIHLFSNYHGKNETIIVNKSVEFIKEHFLMKHKLSNEKLLAALKIFQSINKQFLSKMETDIRKMLIRHNVDLSFSQIKDIKNYAQKHLSYPLKMMNHYLHIQRDVIINALSSIGAKEFHISKIVIKKYIEKILNVATALMRTEIPHKIESTLKKEGVPKHARKQVSKRLHRHFLKSYGNRKPPCYPSSRDALFLLRIRLHMEEQKVKLYKKTITATLSRQVSRIMNIPRNHVKITHYQRAKPGVAATIEVRTCRQSPIKFKELNKEIYTGNMFVLLYGKRYAVSLNKKMDIKSLVEKPSPKPADESCCLTMASLAGIIAGAAILVFIIAVVIVGIIRRRRNRVPTVDDSYHRLNEEA